MAIVESVNVGPVREVPWGSLKRSAIDKRPVDSAVQVTEAGLAGDGVGDVLHHGGPHQAVYAYAREDLDYWSAEVGREFQAGQFGENLTTHGIDFSQVRAGDRWRIGETVLEVSGVRIPCSTFQGFVDQRQWVRRFSEAGKPGPYLRVIHPGTVSAGDAVDVIERREHEISLEFVFRALTTDRQLIPRLGAEPRLAPFVARRLRERSGRRS